MRLAFADCVFDSDTREVSRAGRLLDLSPKAFELLELLIRERPKALSKETIHRHLWPKVFVSDASMSNLVAELRAALGDDAQKPRILRTVRRFGYAFSAEGRRAASTSTRAYRLIWERREIDLVAGDNLFGREHEAAIWIDDPSVSRNHARIVIDEHGASLEDLGSKNGTFLNGAPVRGSVGLSDGDAVQVGRAAMTFHVLEQTGSTQTVGGLKPPGKTSRPKP